MLASTRYFFRFIELDEEFDKYGFRHKVRPGYSKVIWVSVTNFHKQNGAAFKLNYKNTVCKKFIVSHDEEPGSLMLFQTRTSSPLAALKAILTTWSALKWIT